MIGRRGLGGVARGSNAAGTGERGKPVGGVGRGLRAASGRVAIFAYFYAAVARGRRRNETVDRGVVLRVIPYPRERSVIRADSAATVQVERLQ